MSGYRILMLGGGEGWHFNELRAAADRNACELHLGSYQSLRGEVHVDRPCDYRCDAGSLAEFDAILTRTMPAGTLEAITFRLATLHGLIGSPARVAVVNPPRALEIAIDKFATLDHVSRLGYPVPETRVVQSRSEANAAFRELGGDCVVKPIFGGEGRGVMRIRDRELAWYTFSTLENLGAIFYVQQFVPPGGRDTRLLVIGDSVLAFRRTNAGDFRTNVASGGQCERIDASEEPIQMAKLICRSIGLKFASVDLLDRDHDGPCVLEVNGIPGWKGAQGVSEVNIANQIMRLLCQEAAALREVSVP